jgi:hypothetical protein
MPDGMITPLLWINEYRPEWRSPYLLASPVALPRGARVVMTSYFDNESAQPVTVRPQAWMLTSTSRRPDPTAQLRPNRGAAPQK